MAVAPWIVSDELWELVEPLLPRAERRFRYPGRKRLPDRQALQGILFVLHTGIAWRHLPLELGFGSGVDLLAAARRVAAGGRVGAAARVLLPGCVLPVSSSGRGRSSTPSRAGEKGGSATGPSPVDRARTGSKHHLLVDATRDPARLGAHAAATARRHPADPAARPGSARARPRRPAAPTARPGHAPTAATTTTSTAASYANAASNPRSPAARPNTAPASGRYRWVVERTFAWLHQFKRLLVRYDRRAEIHEAFLALGMLPRLLQPTQQLIVKGALRRVGCTNTISLQL